MLDVPHVKDELIRYLLFPEMTPLRILHSHDRVTEILFDITHLLTGESI
jgi:hypothetical protein